MHRVIERGAGIARRETEFAGGLRVIESLSSSIAAALV